MMTTKYGTSRQAVRDTLAKRKGLTAKEIATVVGLSYETVRNAIRDLRDGGEIHACGWRTVGNHAEARYALGAKRPVPKPAPKHARAKRTDESRDFGEARERLERARKAKEALAQPAFRHPQDVALFGEYRSAA